jgi:hypothetical protein
VRLVSVGAAECSSNGCTVTCGANEVIASAVCLADSALAPQVQATSAKCGPSKGITALCAKQ